MPFASVFTVVLLCYIKVLHQGAASFEVLHRGAASIKVLHRGAASIKVHGSTFLNEYMDKTICH